VEVVAALESFLSLLGLTLDLIWPLCLNLDGEVVDAKLLTDEVICLIEDLLLPVEVSVLECEVDRQRVLLVTQGPDAEVMDVVNPIDLVDLELNLVVVDACRGCFEESFDTAAESLPGRVEDDQREEVCAARVNIPHVGQIRMVVEAIMTPIEFMRSPRTCRYAASTLRFLFFARLAGAYFASSDSSTISESTFTSSNRASSLSSSFKSWASGSCSMKVSLSDCANVAFIPLIWDLL